MPNTRWFDTMITLLCPKTPTPSWKLIGIFALRKRSVDIVEGHLKCCTMMAAKRFESGFLIFRRAWGASIVQKHLFRKIEASQFCLILTISLQVWTRSVCLVMRQYPSTGSLKNRLDISTCLCKSFQSCLKIYLTHIDSEYQFLWWMCKRIPWDAVGLPQSSPLLPQPTN